MGAGSTRVTSKEKFSTTERKQPCKSGCISRHIVKGTENYRFQNTGKPYLIEECYDCKRQYVREL